MKSYAEARFGMNCIERLFGVTTLLQTKTHVPAEKLAEVLGAAVVQAPTTAASRSPGLSGDW